MALSVLDLFSGIGGFSYAFESTGHFETVAFCENNKFCQKVLKKNFPNVKIYEDVRSINGKEIKADVVAGGFPCQSFSVAGKRRGTGDDRYLWPEMFRVITEVKPSWVVWENVQGIINIENGLVLRQVQDDLEKEGFQSRCFVIPASGVGAWHQRKRIWGIAFNENNWFDTYPNSNGKSGISKYGESGQRELGESHVCDSQHNGPSTTQEQRGNTQTATGSQEGKNSSTQSKRTSRSTDNGNVSNTHDSRDRASRHGSQREGEKNAKEGQNRSQFESSRHSKNDVSNSQCLGWNERTKIGETHQGKPKQSDNSSDKSSPNREKEDVSNSQHQRWSDQSGRGHRELGEKSREKEKRGDQSALCSSTRSAERGTDEDVSNSQNRSREQTQWQGRESIGRGSDDRSRLEREGKNIETDVSNSSSEGQLFRESGKLGEESRETQGARENDTQSSQNKSAGGSQDVPNTHDSGLTDRSKQHQGERTPKEKRESSTSRFNSVSNSNGKGLQRYGVQTQLETKSGQESSERGAKEQHTWWEAEREFCGVPNGVSYELQRDRVSRIKALGNSIVPQIVFQIAQAIIKSKND